jgi:hypothetical protein
MHLIYIVQKSVSAMAERQTYSTFHEQEREIVTILIDSDLYLDMELEERHRLLQHIVTSFFESPAK